MTSLCLTKNFLSLVFPMSIRTLGMNPQLLSEVCFKCIAFTHVKLTQKKTPDPHGFGCNLVLMRLFEHKSG